MKSKPKKDLQVCTGKSCTRNHAQEIIKNAKRHSEVNIATSCCMGLCSMAPTVVVDGNVISNVNPNQISQLLGEKEETIKKSAPILDDTGLENISDLLDI